MYENSIIVPIPEFVQQTYTALTSIDHDTWHAKPVDGGWSKKEILGHLIDSAHNNIRRLVVTQYQINDKIVYDQDEWVQYNDYQGMDIQDILDLWRLLSQQFHRISQNIRAESLERTCDTGKKQIELHPLSFIIHDYWGHQQHHLRQIL